MKSEATESDNHNSLWKWLLSLYSRQQHAKLELTRYPIIYLLGNLSRIAMLIPDAASATVKIFDSVLHISAT